MPRHYSRKIKNVPTMVPSINEQNFSDWKRQRDWVNRKVERFELRRQRLLGSIFFSKEKFNYYLRLRVYLPKKIIARTTNSFRSKIWINKHLPFCRMENRKLSSSWIFLMFSFSSHSVNKSPQWLIFSK